MGSYKLLFVPKYQKTREESKYLFPHQHQNTRRYIIRLYSNDHVLVLVDSKQVIWHSLGRIIYKHRH